MQLQSGLPSAAWPGATILGLEADSDASSVRWICSISAGSSRSLSHAFYYLPDLAKGDYSRHGAGGAGLPGGFFCTSLRTEVFDFIKRPLYRHRHRVQLKHIGEQNMTDERESVAS